jgi:hypothetical protein
MYDYSKLRGKIVEVFSSIGQFATVLGCSFVSVSNKLNNHTDFSRRDIERWAELLGIAPEDYGIYFFTKKV